MISTAEVTTMVISPVAMVTSPVTTIASVI
jgi:hypothetical protein